MIYIILMFFGQATLPETILLTNQHGEQEVFKTQDGSIDWILFGGDAKTVRLVSRWIKQNTTELLTKGIFVTDITDMPSGIKARRFLPKTKALSQKVYILDGQGVRQGLSWLPYRKGVFTLIILKKNGKHQLHFPESLPALNSILEDL